MNVELILSNMEILKERIEQGQQAEACETMLNLSRLLIADPPKEPREARATRKLYGSYAGAASSLCELFKMLKDNYLPSEDMKDMVTQIEALQQELNFCGEEARNIREQNKKLLDQETALNEKKAELETLKKQVDKLSYLKNVELNELKKEIAGLEQELARLQQACEQAGEKKAQWQATLRENIALINQLPESVAAEHIDKTILQMKERAQQLIQKCEDAERQEAVGQLLALQDSELDSFREKIERLQNRLNRLDKDCLEAREHRKKWEELYVENTAAAESGDNVETVIRQVRDRADQTARTCEETEKMLCDMLQAIENALTGREISVS